MSISIVDQEEMLAYLERCYEANPPAPTMMISKRSDGRYVTLENSKGMDIQTFNTFSGAKRYLEREAEIDEYELVDCVYQEVI